MKTDGTRQRPPSRPVAPETQGQSASPNAQRPIDLGQQPPAPVDPGTLPPVRPAPGALSAAELQAVAEVGGRGLRGTGALTGRLELMDAPGPQGRMVKTPTLVTANPGLRSAVRFALDLPAAKARPRLGQTVEVAGTIEKTTDHAGKITGARLGEVTGHETGGWVELRGTASARAIMGLGGEAPPSGIYLELDRPAVVDGEPVRALFVDRDFSEAERQALDGQPLVVHGQLGRRGWGGVETAGGTVTTLGRTALREPYGEPAPVDLGDARATRLRFADGTEARTLMLADRAALDGDSAMLALGRENAHVGVLRSGMAGDGRFGGFVGAPRPIRPATEADRQAVRFATPGATPTVEGRPLERAAHDPGAADAMASTWWVDRQGGRAYEVLNGGVAGFTDHVARAVDLDGVNLRVQGAPPPPLGA